MAGDRSIFVDTGFTHPGRNPLAATEADMPEFGRVLRADLDAGGRFPP